MPKIYRTHNNLKSELYKTMLKIGLLWFASLSLIISLEVLDILKYFGILVIVISSLLTSIIGENLRTLMSGINGENKAFKMIEELSNNYTVFSNLNISFDGEMNETDLIVVGEKGVFLFEIKNHTGVILGNDKDHQWKQLKVTDNGGKYTNLFYNPIKQVNTHVFRLSQILKDAGYFGWIQGVVYFSNSESEIKVKTRRLPLIDSNTSIKDFLNNYEPKKTLNEDDIDIVIRTLKEIAKNNELQLKQQKTS